MKIRMKHLFHNKIIVLQKITLFRINKNKKWEEILAFKAYRRKTMINKKYKEHLNHTILLKLKIIIYIKILNLQIAKKFQAIFKFNWTKDQRMKVRV